MSYSPESQHHADDAPSGSVCLPEEAARAANIMLDALISPRASSRPEQNILAYELALEPLENPYSELDQRIDDSHIMGASLMNQAWLAGQLAQSTGVDFESVISDLRTHIDTFPKAQ